MAASETYAERNPVETVFTSTKTASPRAPGLDVLRGLLLVWMTLTHLPTRVSIYSNQVIGYVSAAEGFIFLAALLTGQIYRRSSSREGTASARRRPLQRAFRIYRYHIGLLAVAFIFAGAAASFLHRVPLQNLLDFYLQHPKVALAAAPGLLYNPPLLDILPVYIVFMVLTPALLWAIERRGWRAVLGASALVWFLAQFQLRTWIYNAAAHHGFPIPLNETGAFDLFGWQFLWTTGLVLGSSEPGTRFSGSRISRLLLALCGAIAITLFICRHTAFDTLTGPALFDVLVDKWKLGILRLINFAALSVILIKYGPRLAATKIGLRFAPLGRASLEVFSAHVLFCLVVLGFGQGPDPRFAWWQDAIILTAVLTGLFMVAEIVERRRIRAKEAITAPRLAFAPEPLLR